MRSNILAAALLLLLLAAPLGAQQGPTVSLKVDLVAWGNEIRGLSLKPGGGGKNSLTALGFRYSTPVPYSGPAVMEIFQTDSGPATPLPEPSADDLAHELKPLVVDEASDPAANAPKQGIALELEKRREKEPTLVALAVLPSGCRRATVLLAPNQGGTFTAYVIDDDPTKLPLGQVRIHNLCPLPIALRCSGKARQELKTRDTMVVPATKNYLVYELAYQLDGEWKMQENNVIPVLPTEQTQLIILKSRNSFFLSSDGSSGGFLQLVTLRRSPSAR